jgi:hypothetical protein
MITVAEVLSSIIMESPFLEEGIAEGIINLSALARKLQPRLETALMKPVSESAIIMALKRLSPKVTQKMKINETSICQLGDLTVRSDLSEFTFIRSDLLLEKQKKLLHAIKDITNSFVTFTQGVYEITAIVNSRLESTVERIFKGERLVAHETNLAAITIRLTPESLHTPGVHYSVLKQLAWYNINVVEVVSTYTEFTIILNKSQVDTSFSVLMRFLSKKK